MFSHVAIKLLTSRSHILRVIIRKVLEHNRYCVIDRYVIRGKIRFQSRERTQENRICRTIYEENCGRKKYVLHCYRCRCQPRLPKVAHGLHVYTQLLLCVTGCRDTCRKMSCGYVNNIPMDTSVLEKLIVHSDEVLKKLRNREYSLIPNTN